MSDSEGFTFTISNPWLAACIMPPILRFVGIIDGGILGLPLWVVFVPMLIQASRFVLLLGVHIWRNADPM